MDQFRPQVHLGPVGVFGQVVQQIVKGPGVVLAVDVVIDEAVSLEGRRMSQWKQLTPTASAGASGETVKSEEVVNESIAAASAKGNRTGTRTVNSASLAPS